MSIIKILDTWTYLKRQAVTQYQVTVNETITGTNPEDGFSAYGYNITYPNGNEWSGEAVPAGTVLTITAWADGEGFVSVNGEDISNYFINITISANTVINIECGYYDSVEYLLTLHYGGESMCSFVLFVDGTEWAREYNTGTYQYYIPENASVLFETYPDADYSCFISENNFVMDGPRDIHLDCIYTGVAEPERATLIIEPDMGAYGNYFDWGLENARFNVESHGPYFVDNVTLGFSGNVNEDPDQVIWYAGDTVSINLQTDYSTRYWIIDTESLQSIQLTPGENKIIIPCTFTH